MNKAPLEVGDRIFLLIQDRESNREITLVKYVDWVKKRYYN